MLASTPGVLLVSVWPALASALVLSLKDSVAGPPMDPSTVADDLS